MSNLNTIKGLWLLVIFIVGFFGVLTPFVMQNSESAMSYANLTSVGVLLSAALIHMLQHADSELSKSNNRLARTADNEPYPWAFFFATVSFLVLFYFERSFQNLYTLCFMKKQLDADLGDVQLTQLQQLDEQHRIEDLHAKIDVESKNDESDSGGGDDDDIANAGSRVQPPKKSMKTRGDMNGFFSLQESPEDDPEIADMFSETRSPSKKSRKDRGGPCCDHDHFDSTLQLVQGGHLLAAATLMFGLGIHSVITGVALGASKKTAELTAMGIATIFHKYLAALPLGIQVVKGYASLKPVLAVAFLFSSLTPVGMGVGWLMADSIDSAVSELIVSIAAGMFLYVGIFDVLIPEWGNMGEDEHHHHDNEYDDEFIDDVVDDPRMIAKVGSGNANKVAPQLQERIRQRVWDNELKHFKKMCAVVGGFALMSVMAIWT